MESGCFTCMTFKRPPKAKRKSTKRNPQSNDSVPTTFEYAKDGGKEVLRVLESAAGWIPVPCIQDIFRVALKMVEACEEVSEIELQVLQLRDRVCGLMVAILDYVTENPGSDAILDAGRRIEDEIKTLSSTLSGIIDDLNDIKEQHRWLLVFFSGANKTKVDECMEKLATALERFNLSNQMYTADSLRKIESRLENIIQTLTGQVSKQVDDLSTQMNTGFSTVMNELNNAKARKATLLFIRQPMPLKPRIFHGRDDFVEDVARLLVIENTSRVCILGPGGMGKTSLALAVTESSTIQSKFTERNRYWVPCIEATSTNLFLQILYTNLQITRDTKDPLNDILHELGATDEPRLILLDNFETPWNTPSHTQSQVNDIICRIARMKHVALLVTMRGVNPPTDDIVWQPRNLPPTDAEACRQIYHEINPSSKDDPHVDKLLQTIGYMPFAVTLMATLGKEGQSSAKKLLDEWSRTGTDMLSDVTNERSMNKSISLSVDSNLMKRNPDALTLLATLAMLPAGTTRHRLHDWAPSLKSLPLAIATLSKAGLLMVNDGDTSDTSTLFILPVVQSYMLLHNRISAEVERNVHHACCCYVLAHRSRSGDPDFKIDAEALNAEDTNIQSVFQGKISSAKYATAEFLDAFVAFNWHLHDTKSNISLATQAVEVSKKANNKKCTADSLFCLGSTYLKVDQFELSRARLEQACALFHDLSKSEPDSTSTSLSKAGRCGLIMADCMLFLQISSRDIFRVLEVAEGDFRVAGDVHGEALHLVQLGRTYNYQRATSTALTHLEEAREKLEKSDQRLDLAHCLRITAQTQYDAERFSEALKVGEMALEIVEGLGEESDLYLHSCIIHDLSRALSQLGQTTEALEYAKKSLVSYDLNQGPLGVAQTWEQIGFIYLLQSKFTDAYAAYQAALDTYTSLGPITMAKNGQAQCTATLEKIKLKQGDPSVQVVLNGTQYDNAADLTPVCF